MINANYGRLLPRTMSSTMRRHGHHQYHRHRRHRLSLTPTPTLTPSTSQVHSGQQVRREGEVEERKGGGHRPTCLTTHPVNQPPLSHCHPSFSRRRRTTRRSTWSVGLATTRPTSMSAPSPRHPTLVPAHCPPYTRSEAERFRMIPTFTPLDDRTLAPGVNIHAPRLATVYVHLQPSTPAPLPQVRS